VTAPRLKFPEHADPGPDSTDTAASRIRDALAVSAGRVDREHPKALDLAAQALVALGDHLRGVAGMLRGTHSEDHWREMLRGERTYPLYDLSRLGTDPSREAQQAFVACLRVLAAQAGYQLVAGDPSSVVTSEAFAGLAETTGALQAAYSRATADGVVDDLEARVLAELADAADVHVEKIKSLALGRKR